MIPTLPGHLIRSLTTQASTSTRVLTCTTEIETCGLNDDDLGALAKKTFILIATVGPYGLHGEHVSERLQW